MWDDVLLTSRDGFPKETHALLIRCARNMCISNLAKDKVGDLVFDEYVKRSFVSSMLRRRCKVRMKRCVYWYVRLLRARAS